MAEFRIVRQFGSGIRLTDNKAYRVETTELMTEAEAFKLMKELGSPYVDRKYEGDYSTSKQFEKVGEAHEQS